MHIPPQSRIAQTRYLLYGLPIPRLSRPWRRPGDRPVCVTKLPAIPATRSGKGTYPHTGNPPHSWVLRHNALSPAASPAARSRSPRTASPGRLSTRLPTPVTYPTLVFGIFFSTPILHSLSTYARKVSGEFNERPYTQERSLPPPTSPRRGTRYRP